MLSVSSVTCRWLLGLCLVGVRSQDISLVIHTLAASGNCLQFSAVTPSFKVSYSLQSGALFVLRLVAIVTSCTVMATRILFYLMWMQCVMDVRLPFTIFVYSVRDYYGNWFHR